MDLSHELPFPASSDYFRIFRSNSHQILFRDTTLSNPSRVNQALAQLKNNVSDLNELELFALFVSTREIMLDQSSVRRHCALKSLVALSKTFLKPHVIPYILILAHDPDSSLRHEANIAFSSIVKELGGLKKCLPVVIPALGSIGTLCLTVSKDNRFNYEYSLRSLAPSVIQSSIDILHHFHDDITRPMLRLMFCYLPSVLHSLSDFLQFGQYSDPPVPESALFTPTVRHYLYSLLKELRQVPHSPRIPEGSLRREQSPQCVAIVSELLSNESLSFDILNDNVELLKACLPKLCSRIPLSEISSILDILPDDAAAIVIEYLYDNQLIDVVNLDLLEERTHIVDFLQGEVLQYVSDSFPSYQATQSHEPQDVGASHSNIEEASSISLTQLIMETSEDISDEIFSKCTITEDLLEFLCKDFNLLVRAIRNNESIASEAIVHFLKSGEDYKIGSKLGRVYSQFRFEMEGVDVTYEFLKAFYNEVDFSDAPIELTVQFLNGYIENTFHCIEILVYEKAEFIEDAVSQKLRSIGTNKLQTLVDECVKNGHYNVLLYLSFIHLLDMQYDYYEVLINNDVSLLQTTQISEIRRDILSGGPEHHYTRTNDMFEFHLQVKQHSEGGFEYEDLRDIIIDLGMFHDVHAITIKYIEKYLLGLVDSENVKIIQQFEELSSLFIPSSATYLSKGINNMFLKLLATKPSRDWIKFGASLQNAPTAVLFGYFSAIADNMDNIESDVFCEISRSFPSAAFQWSQLRTKHGGFTFTEEMRSLSTGMKQDLYDSANAITISDVSVSISENLIEFIHESPNETFTLHVLISPDYPFGSLTFRLSSLGKEKSTRDCKNEVVKEFIRTGNIIKSVSTWHARTTSMSATFDVCPVCLSLLDAAGNLPKVRCSKCGKGVHTQCIVQWRKKSLRKDCPTCRSPWKKMKR